MTLHPLSTCQCDDKYERNAEENSKTYRRLAIGKMWRLEAKDWRDPPAPRFLAHFGNIHCKTVIESGKCKQRKSRALIQYPECCSANPISFPHRSHPAVDNLLGLKPPEKKQRKSVRKMPVQTSQPPKANDKNKKQSQKTVHTSQFEWKYQQNQLWRTKRNVQRQRNTSEVNKRTKHQTHIYWYRHPCAHKPSKMPHQNNLAQAVQLKATIEKIEIKKQFKQGTRPSYTSCASKTTTRKLWVDMKEEQVFKPTRKETKRTNQIKSENENQQKRNPTNTPMCCTRTLHKCVSPRPVATRSQRKNTPTIWTAQQQPQGLSSSADWPQ